MITSHGTIRVDNEPQFVFGQLVKLAFEHGIVSYHSDLFHDAMWLNDHWQAIQNAGVFFYSVRETGTCIGLDEKLVIRMDDGRLFRCVLPPKV